MPECVPRAFVRVQWVLSIRTTPKDACFNQDSGYELPDYWIATYKKLKGGVSLSFL